MKKTSAITMAIFMSIASIAQTQALEPNQGPLVVAVLAAEQSAADLADKKSRDDGGEVTLTVTNSTDAPIRVNWVDGEGKEGTSEDVIAVGESREMGRTYAGHFFRARNASANTLLQEFRIKDDGGKFNITIAGDNAANVAADKPVAANPAPAPVHSGNGGVAVPDKGPQVNKDVAKKNLMTNMQQQIDEFMKLHNDARAEVGVPPLQWDPKLAQVAQKWAEKLAAKGNDLEHSSGPYGENLAGYLPEYGERPVHGAHMWYEEIKGYTGQKVGDPEPPVVGHYTQMVWRGTTHVGFGMAIAPNGMAILCANYSPGGNMVGEKPY